jgi:hypothetical protein
MTGRPPQTAASNRMAINAEITVFKKSGGPLTKRMGRKSPRTHEGAAP